MKLEKIKNYLKKWKKIEFIFCLLFFIFPLKVKAAGELLVDCAEDGSCRDVNNLLEQAIKIGEWLFSIIGALALVMFIYGGFTIILSMGNAEKVKKGQQALVAAVVGMAIAFSAYILIGFILEALGVSSEFRGV